MLKIGKGAFAPPFLVMDFIASANRVAARIAPEHVIRMEVGQPGTGAPAGARAAVAAALQSGDPLGYTEAFGRPSLRARIAAHYQDWYHLALPAARIAVTMGASGAFPLAFLAAFDPGDHVALASPYYPPYVNILTALGLIPVILECGIETGFQPSLAMLQKLDPQPAGVIIASPANPTGSMMAPADLAAIAQYCHASGIRLISDEIYHGLTYGKPIASAAQFSPSAIVINSFSKYFSMTGWRVGWMILPEDLARPAECLAQNFFISAPHISQIAAEAAFDCAAELETNKARYAQARTLLLAGLPQAGLPHLSPADGAFYLYADITDRGEPSDQFTARMLNEIHIAASPGLDFDKSRGRQFVRFSYCAPLPDIERAIDLLRAWR